MGKETQEIIETIERLHALREGSCQSVPVMGGMQYRTVHPGLDNTIQALLVELQHRLAPNAFLAEVRA